jgi:hypothetical protein
MVRISMG